MPLATWRVLGSDILGFLRADLKKAKSNVWIVGPWIDAFFAKLVIDMLPQTIRLCVATRPPSGANADFFDHAVAARVHFEARSNTFVKLLLKLHAKVIIIDDEIAYCGSANWYRYSLEESREIVLRGSIASVPGLLDEVQLIWDQATSESVTNVPVKVSDIDCGYMSEIDNPVVLAKLKEVPGSFIINQPDRGSSTKRKKLR